MQSHRTHSTVVPRKLEENFPKKLTGANCTKPHLQYDDHYNWTPNLNLPPLFLLSSYFLSRDSPSLYLTYPKKTPEGCSRPVVCPGTGTRQRSFCRSRSYCCRLCRSIQSPENDDSEKENGKINKSKEWEDFGIHFLRKSNSTEERVLEFDGFEIEISHKKIKGRHGWRWKI